MKEDGHRTVGVQLIAELGVTASNCVQPRVVAHILQPPKGRIAGYCTTVALVWPCW